MPPQLQHCFFATLQLCKLCNFATLQQLCNFANFANLQLCNFANLQLCNFAKINSARKSLWGLTLDRQIVPDCFNSYFTQVTFAKVNNHYQY